MLDIMTEQLAQKQGKGRDPGRGDSACCDASVAQVATTSLYAFLEVGDDPEEGRSADIVSIVFLMTEMAVLWLS
jgi:hypothetical protein